MCHYKTIAKDKDDSELLLLKEGMYLPDYYECKYICDGKSDLNCHRTEKEIQQQLYLENKLNTCIWKYMSRDETSTTFQDINVYTTDAPLWTCIFECSGINMKKEKPNCYRPIKNYKQSNYYKNIIDIINDIK